MCQSERIANMVELGNIYDYKELAFVGGQIPLFGKWKYKTKKFCFNKHKEMILLIKLKIFY